MVLLFLVIWFILILSVKPLPCLAYLVLNNPDPIDLTAKLINAYQTVFPLTELEISVIIYFISLSPVRFGNYGSLP
ncbi:MAG: hypothetical protein CM1200mP10_07310 [Candidatus Neomarinimicrobiota bacterium]|nr:MAG: hypothetical protein CM1200mP10_07310 [Candidatus Neomarinimicrobiota bacterium]